MAGVSDSDSDVTIALLAQGQGHLLKGQQEIKDALKQFNNRLRTVEQTQAALKVRDIGSWVGGAIMAAGAAALGMFVNPRSQ